MIKIGIAGFGNIGRACLNAVRERDDFEVVAIFTRREDAERFAPDGVAVERYAAIEKYKGKIDVMLLCMGSEELPKFAAEFLKYFCIADAYGNDERVKKYLVSIDKVARENKKTAVVAAGWDPGIFSLHRLLMESVAPKGKTLTFWGKGVALGHTNALKRIEGVKRAIAYTIPIERSLDAARESDAEVLKPRQMHQRQCFIVPQKGADLDTIEDEIRQMRDYFEDYNVSVVFIDEDEFNSAHTKLHHSGFCIRYGKTKSQSAYFSEFSLKMKNSADFTAGVLLSYARAAKRLFDEGNYGAKTVFDIPPKYISDMSDEDLRDLL